ncbi:MAG TPA: ClpX C4-type zinc finger protein [Mycobacteriales bacterium]|nr:ClpX C4-type zinc finger protein [Mycobacteriales bacterium]
MSPDEMLQDVSVPPIASHCSFCSRSAEVVDTLVAGPGVFICNDCVALCGEVIKSKHDIVPDQPGRDRKDVKVWEIVDDDGLLAHLPRIEAVRHQVDDDLRGWVGEARRRGLSWDRIGAALGMRRQSAWERFG